MSEKSYDTTFSMLEDGAILRVYNSKDKGKTGTMLAVSPAYGIDMVKFTMITIGSHGKDANNVYLPVPQMLWFAEEYANGTAAKKFAEDKGNIPPKAYAWRSGKDGCRGISIGGGYAPGSIRVHTFEKDTAGRFQNKDVSIPAADVLELLRLFHLTLGEVQFTAGSYQEKLYRAFVSGQEKIAEYHKNGHPEIEDETLTDINRYSDVTDDVTEQDSPEVVDNLVETPAAVKAEKNEPILAVITGAGEKMEAKDKIYYSFPATVNGTATRIVFPEDFKYLAQLNATLAKKPSYSMNMLAKYTSKGNWMFKDFPDKPAEKEVA